MHDFGLPADWFPNLGTMPFPSLIFQFSHRQKLSSFSCSKTVFSKPKNAIFVCHGCFCHAENFLTLIFIFVEPNLIPGEFYFRWGIDTNSFFSFTNNDQESLRNVLIWADKPNPNQDPFNPRLTVEQNRASGEQSFYPLPLPEAEIDYSKYKSPCPDSPWSLEIQQQISRIPDSCTLLGTSDQINYYYSMRGPAGFSWQGTNPTPLSPYHLQKNIPFMSNSCPLGSGFSSLQRSQKTNFSSFTCNLLLKLLLR